MTNRAETQQDGKTVEAPKASNEAGFDLSLLWLWPILLLQAIIDAFTGHALSLKALRQADPAILPDDWPPLVEKLRTSEWTVRAYLAAKACKLLHGEALDLSNTWVPAAPSDWRRPEPKSARELILRLEALAAAFANPMRHVVRYARRLARSALLADPRRAEAFRVLRPEPASCAAPGSPAILTQSWTLGIPAPP